LLLQAGELKSATGYLREATKQDPQNANAFYNLGKGLLLAGDAESAVPVLERCAEIRPDDPSPHYQLARALDKLGLYADAHRQWQLFAELTRAQPQAGGMASGQSQ
jgi:Flp pilus assembly protein TadD